MIETENGPSPGSRRRREPPSCRGAGRDDPDALAVENVSHWYGARKALDRISFSLEPATFTVLLGLNGAGKSTLFSLITRLYPCREGQIRIFGHDVAASSEALRRIGVVFQPRTLDLDLSVLQNLLYHAALHGIGRKPARSRAKMLLARAGLTERAGDKVRNLSGGQMRRVEIARALLHQPQLLVLDEPTVGLDIEARAALLDHVHELVGSDGVCALWATHLVDEVRDTDHVIVLHLGRIQAHGSLPRILVQSGAQELTAAFHALTRSAAPSEAA